MNDITHFIFFIYSYKIIKHNTIIKCIQLYYNFIIYKNYIFCLSKK